MSDKSNQNERKTFVVGDTHGSYLGLIQALGRAGYDRDRDLLIVLGDTHDGWSEAPKIMEFYMNLPPQNLIYILGNHDEAFIQWVEGGCGSKHPCEEYGGAVTRFVYTREYQDEAVPHAEWLKLRRYFYIDKENRLFVHAGWNPDVAFLDPSQFYSSQYSWNRSFWQGMYEGKNYAKDFKEVFIGHSPTPRYKPFEDKPMLRKNVWNIDTAAGFGAKGYANRGRVTVMDVDSKVYWQSDLSSDLYPNESGRG